jgi:divalent metal cation (Fe/Co/Zn/Cd) transporter
LVLAVTAGFLARETKGLLIGEQASRLLESEVLRLAAANPSVHSANGVTTVHLAPDQVAVMLSAEFHDQATAPDIERAVEKLEQSLKAAFPQIVALFVKPQTAAVWKARASKLRP